MNKSLSILVVTVFFTLQRSVIAVDVAPHISDREIVESLTEIRGDRQRLEDGQKKPGEELLAVEWRLNKRVDDLRSEMNGRFDDMNHRFDTLQWMFGLFVTIALVILGFVLRLCRVGNAHPTHLCYYPSITCFLCVFFTMHNSKALLNEVYVNFRALSYLSFKSECRISNKE